MKLNYTQRPRWSILIQLAIFVSDFGSKPYLFFPPSSSILHFFFKFKTNKNKSTRAIVMKQQSLHHMTAHKLETSRRKELQAQTEQKRQK